MRFIYVQPGLDRWVELLRRVAPDGELVQGAPLDPTASDILLVPDLQPQGEGYDAVVAASQAGATIYHVPDSLDTPLLTQILEAIRPVQEWADELLDASFNTLANEADSEEDVERLKRVTHERWGRLKRESDTAWLGLAEMCYNFQSRQISTPRGPEPLYATFGYETWYAFSMQFLELNPPYSSSLKRAWEIFRIRLGWTVEEMLAVGRSKLTLANGLVADLSNDPNYRDDPKLKDLLATIKTGSFAEVKDKVESMRGPGGATIAFRQEPYDDPALMRDWLRAKDPAVSFLHLQAIYDHAPLTEESTVLVAVNPGLAPEQYANVLEKIKKLLHVSARDDESGNPARDGERGGGRDEGDL